MVGKIKLIFVILLGALVAACNADGNRTNIEVVQDMMDQESVKAQDWDPKMGGKGGQRLPPENTVPRGFTPDKYKGDITAMERKLKNPMAGDFSPEVIELGKAQYEIYCMVCHGARGDGQTEVGKKMPVLPRNFLDNTVRRQSDGRYYSAISNGYGTMGSYDSQIYDKKARWAIVNYIRTLQKQYDK